MLDFSMGEIGLIAAVALVVLGPDKLPQVAKTAGSWMGKAQRFVSQVKNDIDKEIELSELKKIQEDAKKMATDFQNNLKDTQSQIEKEVSDLNKSVESVGKNIQEQASEVTSEINSVKDQWLSSTAPKSEDAEASIENMVEGPAPSGIIEPADSSAWAITPEQVETNNLEAAFNWNEPYDNLPASVEPEQPSEVATEPVQTVATGSSDADAKIAELSKEIEALKAAVMGANHPATSGGRALRARKVRSNSVKAKLNRISNRRIHNNYL